MRLPRAQPRRQLGGVAGLAEQMSPLVADVLRVFGEPARHQVPGEFAHHVDGHRHLALFLALADHPQQPAFHGLVIRRIGRVFDPLQVIDRGRHHFGQPQAGRIQQVQPEGQPLVRRGGRQHLQLAFDEPPLRQAEAASRIHLRPRRPGHADGGPRVAHQVVLIDEEPIEVLQDRDRVPLRRGRQRPLEGPPQRRPALAPAVPAPAAARLRIGQEVPILDAVLVAHRGQRLALVRDRPEQEALGFLAVGALGVRQRLQPVQALLDAGVRAGAAAP